MKYLGSFVLAAVITVFLGVAFSPFIAAAWFIATHSLGDIVRFCLIAYLCLIPISVFAQR